MAGELMTYTLQIDYTEVVGGARRSVRARKVGEDGWFREWWDVKKSAVELVLRLYDAAAYSKDFVVSVVEHTAQGERVALRLDRDYVITGRSFPRIGGAAQASS